MTHPDNPAPWATPGPDLIAEEDADPAAEQDETAAWRAPEPPVVQERAAVAPQHRNAIMRGGLEGGPLTSTFTPDWSVDNLFAGYPTTQTIFGNLAVAGELSASSINIANSVSGTSTPDWLNVQSSTYGAKGDGKFVSNGAMGSGSKILTSASNPFKPTDVGKLIYVYGASVSGLMHADTIASYNSAGSVTLTTGNQFAGAVSGAHVIWGSDDTSAIQAAFDAAGHQDVTYNPVDLCGTVYIPRGIYITTSPLNTNVDPINVRGDGYSSVIFNGTGDLIDFQNKYRRGMKWQELSFWSSAGNIFTNGNIHRCIFDTIQFVQYAAHHSIWTFGTGSSSAIGMSTTEWRNIMFTGYGDPSSTPACQRSVPLWDMYTSSAKSVDGVVFYKCTNFWNPPANITSPDSSQYIWDIACTTGTAGGICDTIIFVQPNGGSPMGGLIRLLSCQGVNIIQPDIGNIYNGQGDGKTIGNSMIYVGNYAGNPASANGRGTIISGYTHESSGIVTWGSNSDIEIAADSTYTTIDTPISTDTGGNGNTLRVNLNAATNVTIINPQQTWTLSNPGVDTNIVGGPGLAVYGDPGNGNFGALAHFTNTRSNPTNAPIGYTVVNATDQVFGTRNNTDTASRFKLDGNGQHQWGAGGAGTADTNLYRKTTAQLATDSSMFIGNRSAPSTPSGGGVLYVSGGTLHYLGSSGTDTPIAPA